MESQIKKESFESTLSGKLAIGALLAASFFPRLALSQEAEEPDPDNRAVATAVDNSPAQPNILAESALPSIEHFDPTAQLVGEDRTEVTADAETSSQAVDSVARDVKSQTVDATSIDQFFQDLEKTDATHGELKVYDADGNVVKTVEVELGQDTDSNKLAIWLGIAACLIGSASLSGMNVGLMSLNRLKLEVLAEKGDKDAQKVLNLRKDGNAVLATILWGNVGVNCLLTLLSDSVLAGATGFAFSVGGLTLFGEILPQGYFSRNALKMGARLAPAIQALKYALYPITRPTGILLDKLVGKESLEFYREDDLKEVLAFHKRHENEEISPIEAQGATNFLALDDISIAQEGENLTPESIIQSVDEEGRFRLPDFEESTDHPFLQRVQAADTPWVVLVDGDDNPRLLLDADAFLRHCVYEEKKTDIRRFCHDPLVVTDGSTTLGEAMKLLRVDQEHPEDDVVDRDAILLWNDSEKKIVTGADILGRLLRGVVQKHWAQTKLEKEGEAFRDVGEANSR
jgi:hypothetical protein